MRTSKSAAGVLPLLIVLVALATIASCGGGGGGSMPTPDSQQEELDLLALRDIGNGQFNDYVMTFNGTKILGGETINLNQNDLVGHITQSMLFDRRMKDTWSGLKDFTDMVVDGEGVNMGYITVDDAEEPTFTSQLWEADQITRTIDFKQFQLKDKPNYVKISGVGQVNPELVVVQVANECKAPTEPPVKREHVTKRNGIFRWIGFILMVGLSIATRGAIGCPDPIDADTFTVCVPPAISTPVIPPPPANQPPTARFTFVADELKVAFDGSTSTDSDGTIVSYDWSFGASGVTVNHTYPAANTYSVTLTVTDDDGATDTETKTVSVTVTPPPVNQSPTARLVPSPSSGNAPLNVSWDASGSTDADGTIVQFDWDMDNNGVFEVTDGGNTRSVTYVAAGTFTVGVRVTDDDGATDTETKTVSVTVTPPPGLTLNGEPFDPALLRTVFTPGDSNGDGIVDEDMVLNGTNLQFDTFDLELYYNDGPQRSWIGGSYFVFNYVSSDAPAGKVQVDTDGTVYTLDQDWKGTVHIKCTIQIKTDPEWYVATRKLDAVIN